MACVSVLDHEGGGNPAAAAQLAVRNLEVKEEGGGGVLSRTLDETTMNFSSPSPDSHLDAVS